MIDGITSYILSKIIDFIPMWLFRNKYIKNLRIKIFSNNFWKIISENCCFIIPAHPKKRMSISAEPASKINTGTGYNDCIAVGRLSQYIYSIAKSQIPIFEAAKGNASKIHIWREESDNDFSFEYEKYPIDLYNNLDKKNNYIIIGGPESNIISKILFDKYITSGPIFNGNDVRNGSKTIFDAKDDEYGGVLLYYLSFNSTDTENRNRIMMIAGCHGPDTRRVVNHLQNKVVIKKITQLSRKPLSGQFNV
ncbi:MAG: hypothetical protein SCH70_13700 [Candidatus Methanoperedens sp.]|nr:hypothetical protein [Candidatus Methanoperedens sp.]